MKKRTLNLVNISLLSATLLVVTSSCDLYRMPREEDNLRSVPITNNACVLDKPAPNLIPGVYN